MVLQLFEVVVVDASFRFGRDPRFDPRNISGLQLPDEPELQFDYHATLVPTHSTVDEYWPNDIIPSLSRMPSTSAIIADLSNSFSNDVSLFPDAPPPIKLVRQKTIGKYESDERPDRKKRRKVEPKVVDVGRESPQESSTRVVSRGMRRSTAMRRSQKRREAKVVDVNPNETRFAKAIAKQQTTLDAWIQKSALPPTNVRKRSRVIRKMATHVTPNETKRRDGTTRRSGVVRKKFIHVRGNDGRTRELTLKK